MRINCLGCGHMLDLGDAYDDYHGQVKCNVCRSVMYVEFDGCKLRSARLEDNPCPPEGQD